jgi:hypothetical protein
METHHHHHGSAGTTSDDFPSECPAFRRPGRPSLPAHCHIAEHHESRMMFSFTVDPATE